MTGKTATILGKTTSILRLIVLMSAALLILIPLGCKKKEKPPGPDAKAVGTCEVFDRLPEDILKPVDITYGDKYSDKAKFLGLTVRKLSPDKLKISYHWQLLNELGPYGKAFVVFTDKAGKQLSGNDHDLCEKRPFAELKGKFIKETYTVDILQTMVGKKIDIGIGIFSPDLNPDASRLKVTLAGKSSVTDNNTRALVEELNL